MLLQMFTYENMGINWYADNHESSLEFLSGPTFPHMQLSSLVTQMSCLDRVELHLDSTHLMII